jgi:hypothetical protein
MMMSPLRLYGSPSSKLPNRTNSPMSMVNEHIKAA